MSSGPFSHDAAQLIDALNDTWNKLSVHPTYILTCSWTYFAVILLQSNGD